MRIAQHIFRKDIRRLWWESTVTLAILAALTWADRWRNDYTPGTMEGWLNLLLPFAWAYLIALVVLEDPLVGDRQFWVTLPCRWPSIFAAKALFILALIHIPYLVSCSVILGARGFPPINYLPQLFGKQLALVVCLTLPAAALATVVRNVVQFLLAIILLGVAATLMSHGQGMLDALWIPVNYVHNAVTLVVLTAGTLTVVCLQYVRRATSLARAAGAAAVIATAMTYAWLPQPRTLELQCALDSRKTVGEPLSIHFSAGQGQPADLGRRMPATPSRVTLAIPVALSGLTDQTRVYLNQLALQVDTTEGKHYSATLATSRSEYETLPLVAFLELAGPGHARQILRMERALFDQIKDSTTTIRGTVKADSHRADAAVTVPIGGRVLAPGLGVCSSAIVQLRPGEDGLKVVCESPTDIPSGGAVTLMAANRNSWGERLGSAMTFVGYPRNTWLSPMNRRDAFFHLTAEDVSGRAGSRWLVPVSAVSGGHILVTPERTACDMITYELKGIRLSDYLVR
ncbi:MAG TPA: hypothetical protein VGK29_07645 [Paludibaculum sp.]|jgi:hypothetical protein